MTGERKWSVSIASLVGAIPALLLGITLGYPSNALLDLTGEATELQPEYFFSDLMISLFVSLAPLGAIFGGPVGGWIADRWGRKCGMMFCGVPYLIGYLALSYAHYASTVSVFNAILLFGRFSAGFGMGWASAVCPVYTGELCSAKLRGIYGNMFPIFLTSGIVLNYVMGAINDFRYYYISLVAVGIVAVFEVLMFRLPETPRWLLSRGYGEQAEHVLQWLRGKKIEIKKELDDMKVSLKQKKSNTWKLFLKRSTLIPLIYVLIIFAMQQGGGINAITPFAGTLFADAGVSNPRYAAIYAVGGSGIVALIASIVLIDLIGRKYLLVISGTGEILGLVMLGVHSFITRPSLCANSSMTNMTETMDMDTLCNPQYQYLAMCGVIVFVLMFTVGYNSVPYVLISELLPLPVRGKASGIAASVAWFCAALFTGFYLPFTELVTPWFVLWGLAALNVVTVLFILRFIPKTKGKSLEELESKFKKKPAVVETTL